MTDQGQVFEEREGMDEVKNLRAWKDEKKYAEGLEGGRECVERGKRDLGAIEGRPGVVHHASCITNHSIREKVWIQHPLHTCLLDNLRATNK